jgi:hypothetical protein
MLDKRSAKAGHLTFGFSGIMVTGVSLHSFRSPWTDVPLAEGESGVLG